MTLQTRTEDTGVAHGLRQHSIGEAFPAIVVGRGDGTTEVHLGESTRTGLTVPQAFQLAGTVGDTYRAHGWSTAQSVLQHAHI